MDSMESIKQIVSDTNAKIEKNRSQFGNDGEAESRMASDAYEKIAEAIGLPSPE